MKRGKGALSGWFLVWLAGLALYGAFAAANAQEIEPGASEWRNKPYAERHAILQARRSGAAPTQVAVNERIAVALERIATAQEALAATECGRLERPPIHCVTFAGPAESEASATTGGRPDSR